MHYESRKDLFLKKSDNDLKSYLINTLKNSSEIILVIELDDKIIGYAAIQYKGKLEKYLWINEIIIDSDYRNKGYGKKLIEEINGLAFKNNCKRIELNCWSFNKAALKFYEKIGFVQQRIIFEKEVK